MGCGCASKSLFSGGKRKGKGTRKGKRKQTRRKQSKKRRIRGEKLRGQKMKGGVSLLGDLQTGLMDVTNKITGSVLVPPEHYLQPAAHNYAHGNSYLV
jgi:hypothetical protein